MKIYQLIQILCRLDPETDVLFSQDGFPYTDVKDVEKVYQNDLDSVVLTTKKTNFKRKKKNE